uniref:Uncharacterized protein n=1 Tax=Panagrolaimus sp. ES5 TaxID=591445 RepID=A0AC34FX49_9BILA
MRYLAIFISLCLLFDQVNTAGYVFPIKTKVIGKFRQWLSTWLSQAQYVTATLGNNVAAFAAQLQEMWGDYVDAGKTKQRIFQRGYKMIDMFMTKKRVATIYCRIQKYFNTKDVSWWPFFKSNLGSIVMFTTLDGLGGTC